MSLIKGYQKYVLCLMGLAATDAMAATFDLGNDASFSIGAGLRVEYSSVKDGAPNGTSRSNDFNVDNARIYMSGRVTKQFGATFNTERNSSDGIRVMDAYVQYEPMPEFNVWLGRMLPASDRANLDGPFYENAWDYPGLVSRYPSLAVGRDNGAQVWGKLMADKLTYVAGAFKGHNVYTGGSNDAGHLLYAGRIAYAFWDPEPAPAYYTGSTYYGSKDILTLGLAVQTQKDAIGVPASKADFTGWNADLLMEKNLSTAGTLTLEGAYYKYDTGGIYDCGTGTAPACASTDPNANAGGIVQGKGYLATAAFLFPTKIGYGQFQPFTRYQKFDYDLASNSEKIWDVGTNYVIKGHNARVSVFWSKDSGSAVAKSIDKFVVGVQMQI